MDQHKVQQVVWALLNSEGQSLLWPGIVHKVIKINNSNICEYEVTLIDKDEDIECEPIVLKQQEIFAFQTHHIDEKTAPASLIDAYKRAISEYGQFSSKKVNQRELAQHHNLITLGLQKPKQMKNFLWGLCQSSKTIILDEETIEALNSLPMHKKYARQYWQQQFGKILHYLVIQRDMNPRSKFTLDSLRIRMKKLVTQAISEQIASL